MLDSGVIELHRYKKYLSKVSEFRSYYGLKCVPLKFNVDVLTLSPSDCDSIWRQGL